MADVSVSVTGEMEPLPDNTKAQLSNLFQFSQFNRQLPHASEWFAQRRQHVRPWLQFVQTSNFKMPPSIPRLSRRIMRNIEYFQSNYLFVFLGLIAYCLVTSPLLLLAVCSSLYVGYRLSKRHSDKKVVVLGRELTLAEQYGVVALCSLPVYYLVGAGVAVFWVLGASFFVITLHSAFYNIDALVLEDDTFGLTQEV